MSNTALQRITQAVLTNKSGGDVAQGDVVVISTGTATSFTTTTTSPFLNGVVGVVIEPNGIANNATGMVAFAGPIPKVNLSGSASLGDLFKTHTVAKQAVRHAAGVVAGDFGIVLGTGTTPAALLWGLPAGATGAGSGDVVGPSSAVANNLAGFNGTGGKTILDSGLGLDGWIDDTAETWTYASATTFTIAGVDLTTKYQAGQRIKLTQTTVKYFIITAVAFSTNTTVTIYGGTDYTFANAAVSANYHSIAKAPFGFPMDPTKWTLTTSDTSLISMNSNSPVAGTWYNSISLAIAIGVWNVSYKVVFQVGRASAGVMDIFSTLSTANNSESNNAYTSYVYLTPGLAGAIEFMRQDGVLVLAAGATYYLNHKAGQASMNAFQTRGDISPTVIKAVCAYL